MRFIVQKIANPFGTPLMSAWNGVGWNIRPSGTYGTSISAWRSSIVIFFCASASGVSVHRASIVGPAEQLERPSRDGRAAKRGRPHWPRPDQTKRVEQAPSALLEGFPRCTALHHRAPNRRLAINKDSLGAAASRSCVSPGGSRVDRGGYRTRR